MFKPGEQPGFIIWVNGRGRVAGEPNLNAVHFDRRRCRARRGSSGRDSGGGRSYGDHAGGMRNLNFSPVEHCVKRSNRSRVEPLARQRVDNPQRSLRVISLLVWASRGERIEGVRDSDDSRQNGNLITFESMRVSTSIERFMM